MKYIFRLLSCFVFSATAIAQPAANSSLAEAARLMSQGQLTQAIAVLEPLASQRNVAAQHNLAMIYARGGPGVSADLPKALELYQAAAKERFLPSIHNLGVMYQLGQVVQQDYGRAMQNYQVAGRMGYAPALSSIAYLHANGLGHPRDLVAAYAYLLIADTFGDANAKPSVARVKAALTPDEREQGEIIAEKLSQRFIANIKNCQREIAKRNNLPFDEAAPPTSGLMVWCGT
ncbi:tetratricopeptide repeat protein [Paucibacter sp. DJ2R-2]|uniref:tetratricopeptide repeat protein n=1 Tax=Paucibacter sp. DJ2R-2 TaxID=2893558 RepID=UPI0021E40DA2|nr:tetratricopeptide repeat protein [Paucibacter sp. DJ2R-2]MCV2421198.1 sel1 repeat family protein [Paucibacter sp. DJ4R-1]MCV2439176.1 sel1 repeat family protein [Paucibacter sp. DJ2R-2]